MVFIWLYITSFVIYNLIIGAMIAVTEDEKETKGLIVIGLLPIFNSVAVVIIVGMFLGMLFKNKKS